MLKFSMIEDANSDASEVGLPRVKIGPVEWYVELPDTGAIQIHEAAAKIRRSRMGLFQDPEDVTFADVAEVPFAQKCILRICAECWEGSEY